MAEDLIKIWANSEPLPAYFSRLFGDEFEQIVCAEITQITELTSSSKNHELYEGHKYSDLFNMVDELSASFGKSRIENEHRTEMFDAHIKPKLLADQLSIIALAEEQGDDLPQIILPKFWLRAKISKDLNSANSAEYRFTELKVLEDASPLRLGSDELPKEGSPAQILREPARLRLEAIKTCVDQGKVDLSGGPRARRDGRNNLYVRWEVYITYLNETYGDDFEELEGFSEKSFERSEINFKKKFFQ